METKSESGSKKSSRRMPDRLSGSTAKFFKGGHVLQGVQAWHISGWYDQKINQITQKATVPKSPLVSGQERFHQRFSISDEQEETHRQLWDHLRESIRRIKNNYFKQLCDQPNINPWHATHKLVVKRLQRLPHVICSRLSVFWSPKQRKGNGGWDQRVHDTSSNWGETMRNMW